jgi:hypothetical protein
MKNDFMEGVGQAYPASIPASIKGLDAISSLADMPPDHAVQLDNFIPRPGYLEIRRGSNQFAHGIGTSTTSVETIMGYNAPNTANSKLFAMGGGTIYDITAGATASATSVTGWSNSRAQFVNFTNASLNTYLFVANGIDTPQVFNGTTWATAGITGITESTIVQPAVWKGRLWFCMVNSTQVAYMGVGAVSGTASTFDLGSLMSMGGYINAIATWTIDTYQGVDEFIAFISSRGQIFIYQGTDPTTATTFSIVGTYNLGAPIGRRCFLRISGNLWVITQDGIIPLTEMLVKAADRLAAPRVAVTSMIMNAINQAIQLYSGYFGWQLTSYPKGSLVLVNIPTVENSYSFQYVMNTITGAWCRFLNINCNTWEVWNDNPYFGSNDGAVYLWDTGSGDEVGDENYGITATVQTAFNYFNTRGWIKRFTAVRPIINSDNSVTPGVGLNIDFGTGAPISQPSTINFAGALWDVAQWDVALWPVNSSLVANWTTVEGIGQCASIITQLVTSDNGTTTGVLLQLNGWDITMEKGVGFF